jgi:Putative peptidoglycan binding domain
MAVLLTACAGLVIGGHAARAQSTATSPAMDAVTAVPDAGDPPRAHDGEPHSVPDADIGAPIPPPPLPEPEAALPSAGDAAPLADFDLSDPPSSSSAVAATVPGIEDELPDAGNANAPATTRRRGTPSSPVMQAGAPQVAAALPAGSGTLDSATVQRIVDRLVALHLLASAADAQNADAMVQAIKQFQTSSGITPSGALDRDTLGLLLTP